MPKMKYVVNGCSWALKKQEVWRQRGSQEMCGKDMNLTDPRVPCREDF